LNIDPAAYSVRRQSVDIPLTVTEFRLLYELARHPGQVLTRDQLLESVWGYTYLGDSRLVDVHIQRLRAKVEKDPARPVLVQTVRGVGYRAARDTP
jgi:two-component system response regulator MtrA